MRILPHPTNLKEWDLLWDDTVLRLGFRQNLQRSIIRPILEGNPLRDYSFIIYGPPGTGKTAVVKSIAKQFGWKHIYIGPQHFVVPDKSIEHAMKQCIEDIRNYTKGNSKSKTAKCVFVFDEIDELVVSREGDSDRQTRFSTTMMLPLIQDLRDLASERGFIFFFLTNHIERFDPAITRPGRFDLILPLGPPDRQARFLLFEKFIKKISKKYLDNHQVVIRTEYDIDEGGEVFHETTVDLDAVSRASARLTLKDIEKICERVIEQRIAMEPSLLEPRKKGVLVYRYLRTRYFIDWIYKYRNISINKKDIDKFYKDIEMYSRGSTLYPKSNTIQEKVEHEFSSLHIDHNLSELDKKWKVGKKKSIDFSFRNLAGLSLFSGQISVTATIGGIRKSKDGDKGEVLSPGGSSDHYSLAITPKNTGKMKVVFTISGYFDLLGIEEVLEGNRAQLFGRTILSRDITIE